MILQPLPAQFVETRDALHQVAFFAMSPARYRAVGRMGLRATTGGFGTPEFDGKVARVDGDLLVLESGAGIASQRISTVRKAAEFVGVPYEVEWFGDFHDPLQPVDPDGPLSVDVGASKALGAWFEFGTAVLDELRAHGTESDDVSEVQLWPEHFDPATELGAADTGQRASFGASAGDSNHPEPYLYVAAWGDIDRSKTYWNDDSFNGASLTYSRLLETDEPVDLALDFLLRGYEILHG